MPKKTARSLVPLGAVVASGVGESVDIAPDATLDLELAVTAITGTLAVTIETSRDGLNWTPLAPVAGDDTDETDADFPLVSAVGTTLRVFPDARRYVRARWTLSPGGSATFAVTGWSVRVYASPEDMPEFGIRAAWLESLNSRKIDAALRAKTDDVTDAFASGWPSMPVPLTEWGDNIRRGVAACAAVDLMATEGTRPDEDDDRMLIDRCAAFDAWLALVAAGKRGGASTETDEETAAGGATVILVHDCRWDF